MKTTFLKPKGDYRSLIVYRKAECIYDLTYHFAHRFLDRGDRTIDQMVQAARSGKQNIIEGSSASTTSRETEIKLFNVARASFDELLADYDDYMRVRGISPWENEKQNSVREFCRTHNDSALYRQIAPARDDATLANLCLTLIYQEQYLLQKLIERAKADFLAHGGIREEMSQARREYRAAHGYGNYRRYGNNGNNGNNGSYGNQPGSPHPPSGGNAPQDPDTQESH